MKVSLKEFAKIIDVAPSTLSRKVSLGYLGEGLITLPDGKRLVDVELAKAAMKRNQQRDGSLIKAGKRAQYKKALKDGGAEIGIPEDEVAENILQDIGPAKAKRESYLAEIARLEYEEQIKQLVKVEEVQKQAFTMYRETRDALMNIPAKCAPELASMSDVFEITQFLDKFVREVLTDLNRSVTAKYGVENEQ